MIEWIKRRFHPHNWLIHESFDLTYDGKIVGRGYVLKCSVCGDIKGKEIFR